MYHFFFFIKLYFLFKGYFIIMFVSGHEQNVLNIFSKLKTYLKQT